MNKKKTHVPSICKQNNITTPYISISNRERKKYVPYANKRKMPYSYVVNYAEKKSFYKFLKKFIRCYKKQRVKQRFVRKKKKTFIKLRLRYKKLMYK
jgi:hypothetical protein